MVARGNPTRGNASAMVPGSWLSKHFDTLKEVRMSISELCMILGVMIAFATFALKTLEFQNR
jgi:hypothetical protein